MPVWENPEQIRLNDAIIQVDNAALLEKSIDSLQYKKVYKLKIAEFINNAINVGIAAIVNSTAWLQSGNSNGSLKTIGTKDNFDLPFITNNVEKVRILQNGNVGIGTPTPLRKLEIANIKNIPPIRTINMTSSSIDITGILKQVVVDINGDFGVKTLSSGNVNKFYSQQTLPLGLNTITHNLNLTIPKALTLEIRNDINGSIQIVSITAYTTNSITISITTPITLANITIIA